MGSRIIAWIEAMTVRIGLGILAALIVFGAHAQAQTGPSTWAQSVMRAPQATPQTGDVVGFVHNGLTFKCVVGTAGCFNGSGNSGVVLVGGDTTSCTLAGGDTTTCVGD
jgi:hypothetical protein